MSVIKISELRSSFFNELTGQEMGSVKGGDDGGWGGGQFDNNLSGAALVNKAFEEVFQAIVNQNGMFNASIVQQQDT